MQSTFCSSCDGIQATANFCERCGVAIEKPLPYLMSVHRVVTMSLLSGGIYLLWWAYITWKHYRDHTGEEAYPVWHALTLLVPRFRIHAHTRTFKELMMARQLTNSIRPGIAVVIILFVDCLGIIGRINFGRVKSVKSRKDLQCTGLLRRSYPPHSSLGYLYQSRMTSTSTGGLFHPTLFRLVWA